jgi:hypothetical protein
MSARPGLYGGQPVMVVPTVIDNIATALAQEQPLQHLSAGAVWA